MSATYQRLVEPPRGASRAWCALVAAVVLGLIAAGFIVGRAGAGRAADAAAIADVKSIPIGVLHSRAGARAAADSYLVVDQQTIEQDPSRFRALVRSKHHIKDGVGEEHLRQREHHHEDDERDGLGPRIRTGYDH